MYPLLFVVVVMGSVGNISYSFSYSSFHIPLNLIHLFPRLKHQSVYFFPSLKTVTKF